MSHSAAVPRLFVPFLLWILVLMGTIGTSSAFAVAAPTTDLAVGAVTGKYLVGTDTKYTNCTLEVNVQNKPTTAGDANTINASTTVNCSTGNVGITGSSELYDSATSDPLASGSSMYPNLSPTSASSLYYTDSDISESKLYQGYVELNFPVNVGSWIAPAGAASCSGMSTGRAYCYISVTFNTSGEQDANNTVADGSPPDAVDTTQSGDSTGDDTLSLGGFLITADPALANSVRTEQLSLDQAVTAAAAAPVGFGACAIHLNAHITKDAPRKWHTFYWGHITCSKAFEMGGFDYDLAHLGGPQSATTSTSPTR